MLSVIIIMLRFAHVAPVAATGCTDWIYESRGCSGLLH